MYCSRAIHQYERLAKYYLIDAPDGQSRVSHVMLVFKLREGYVIDCVIGQYIYNIIAVSGWILRYTKFGFRNVRCFKNDVYSSTV